MTKPLPASAAPVAERRRWFRLRSLRARLVLIGLLLQAGVLGTSYAVAASGTGYFWFGALLLGVSALTTYAIVTRLTGNLRRVQQTALALERGELDARCRVQSHDELGSFAATFDRMADSFEARRRAELALQSEKEFSEALLAAQPGVVCVLDKSGRLLRWNRNLEAISGYSAGELASVGGMGIIAQTDREKLNHAVYRVFKHGAARIEADLLTRAGAQIPQLWTGARWEAGGETYLVASAVDISEIRALHQQLEQRVAERTAELTRTNRELESFSYTVSHDLSAPLRAINGFSTLLADELGGKLAHSAQHYLDRIVAGSVQMKALIDDLLRLAHISRSRLVAREVDLAALARRVATDCAQDQAWAAAARKVEFRAADGLRTRGDASLLRIALANLIGNAWKFTARSDAAKIEFGALQQDGERVYFLRDNGAGFEMRHAAKLFEPFQRLHNTREFPGTGIGLAIVHRIVERHGGRIWVESAPAAGTTFYFTLGPVA